MNTFGWLLQREYWEHRGGFLRAPLITGGVFLAITLMVLVVGEMAASRVHVNVADIRLDLITANMSTQDLAQLGVALDLALFGIATLVGAVLFFVVFFYLLGALYDDRRDRSVLFWKSLPVSDAATVLSKVASAVVIAPLLAVAAAIVLDLAFLVILSAFVLLHGVNPLTTLWATVSPFTVWAKLLAIVPVNALWALPTVGWLLLCSSFARNKPFLWAIAAPVATGVLVAWFNLMQSVSLPSLWFWKHVVGRLLLSVIPGSWVNLASINAASQANPLESLEFISFRAIGNALLLPEMWIGAVIGAAMIAAAVYFRRYRDDS